MSNPTNPYQPQPGPQGPGGPPQQPPQPGPPAPGATPKKGRVLPAVLTGIVALILGIAIGGAGDGGAQIASPAAPGATVTATTTATATKTVTAPAPAGEPTSEAPSEAPAEAPADDGEFTPKKSDFKVTVKVKEKQCFGSAGCLVTVSVKPSYVGDTDLPDTGTVEVTYEIKGDESGPITNTFTVSGGQAEYTGEESLTTKSSSTKISATVTDVSYDPDN